MTREHRYEEEVARIVEDGKRAVAEHGDGPLPPQYDADPAEADALAAAQAETFSQSKLPRRRAKAYMPAAGTAFVVTEDVAQEIERATGTRIVNPNERKAARREFAEKHKAVLDQPDSAFEPTLPVRETPAYRDGFNLGPPSQLASTLDWLVRMKPYTQDEDTLEPTRERLEAAYRAELEARNA